MMRASNRRTALRVRVPAQKGIGLFILGSMLLGCQADELVFPTQSQPQGLVGEQLFVGQRCAMKQAGIQWLDSEADWRRHQSAAPRQVIVLDDTVPSPTDKPAIDFTTHAVVIVGLGQKPSGGYAVMLGAEGVQRAGDRLLVHVRVEEPAADAFVTQALTAPCVAVKVPRVKVQTLRALDQNGQVIAEAARAAGQG